MGFYILMFIFGLVLVFMVYLGVQESEKQNAIYDSMAEQMKDNPECRKLVEALAKRVSDVIASAPEHKELIDNERAYFVVKIWRTWAATGIVISSSRQPPEPHEKDYSWKCDMLFNGIYGRAGNYLSFDKVCGIDELASNEREPLKRILKKEWTERFPQVPYLLEFDRERYTYIVFEITGLYRHRSKKTLLS